jgi:hypothetical protein
VAGALRPRARRGVIAEDFAFVCVEDRRSLGE